MIGKVLFKVANNFLVEEEKNKEKIKTTIRKKAKKMDTLVGDNVEFIKEEYEYVIERIFERKNFLIRPKVANIDYVLIVYSVKEPDYNSFLLNKFLAFYESRNIKNVIIYFSKIDLLKDDEIKNIKNIIERYKNDGYIVFDSSNKEFAKIEIEKLLNNNVICFAGQSGVGKSTFINFLIPEMNLKTQEISEALNRGKHTTTSSLIIPYKNGYVIDTPGFSSIDLNMTSDELSSSFNDFRNNKTKCKFSNCLHNNEKGCFIKELVEQNKIDKQRYSDYLKMLNNINKKY